MDRSRLSFGPFELDPVSGELLRDGAPIVLREQSLRLLLLLLRKPGRLVTREQLVDELWPDGIHVDFDHGLNTAVRRLRIVLDDIAETPKYIETIPRRGYRFIAAVQPSARLSPTRFELQMDEESIPLPEGAHVIGRDFDSLIRTSLPTISRRHARFIVTADQVTLEDLGSTNGTFIGDRRIDSPTILQNGDVIAFGDVFSVIFQAKAAPPPTEKKEGR